MSRTTSITICQTVFKQMVDHEILHSSTLQRAQSAKYKIVDRFYLDIHIQLQKSVLDKYPSQICIGHLDMHV